MRFLPASRAPCHAPVETGRSQAPQQGEPFHHARLGQLTASNDSPKDGELNEYGLQVHAFTRHATVKGPEPVKALLSTTHASLHGQDGQVTLGQGRLVLFRCAFSTAFQEEGDTPDL